MKVPTIGESITEVTLSQWLKKDGDFVKIDEPICEFESDKATLEFPAEASGKITVSYTHLRVVKTLNMQRNFIHLKVIF